MQWTSYTCAPDKVRGELCAQLLEGTNRVWRQPAKPYPCGTHQRSWKGPAHDLVRHALQVHQGFKKLQVI